MFAVGAIYALLAKEIIGMERKMDDLPNWTFRIEEVSAGAYKVEARHLRGPKVEISGTDPDELLNRAAKSAREIEDAIRSR